MYVFGDDLCIVGCVGIVEFGWVVIVYWIVDIVIIVGLDWLFCVVR